MEKPKRLIAVQHANGKVEFICQKCQGVMILGVSGGYYTVQGEATDNIRESLACPHCDHQTENIPEIPDHVHNQIVAERGLCTERRAF